MIRRAARIARIDDNADELLLTGKMLALQGFDLQLTDYHSAEDWLTALDESEGLPDIVLLDLRLPRLSGLDLLRRSRERPSLGQVIFCICSGSLDQSDRRAALAAGAAAFVAKPLNRDGIEAIAAADPRLSLVDAAAGRRLMITETA
ncbi:MAG: response regulator [Pseudomonadota bacterium]